MNDNNEGCGCVLYILFILIILSASIGISYWIATSDLPDWFKFWLLK